MASSSVSTGKVLGELLPGQSCPAQWSALPVSGIALDSRQIEPGYVFVALAGASHDGRDFIPQAIAGGCAAIVAEGENFDFHYPREGTVRAQLNKAAVPLIIIDDLAASVSTIAARFYGLPGEAMAVYGVTGTNGKTTCAALIGQLCSLLDGPSGLVGTLGYGTVSAGEPALADTGLTTPDAISLQRILSGFRDAGVATVAMEVSSHSLDQHRVDAAGIDCAIFTNLSRDHLDYHGTEEAYGAAKARLFALPGVRCGVVNGDDPFGRKLLGQVPGSVEVFSYGLGGDTDIGVENLRLTRAGISGRLVSPWGSGELSCPLLGEFNAVNLLAVIGALCGTGNDLDVVLDVLPLLKPAPGRMETVLPGSRPHVVVDYAHTPDALDKALGALRQHSEGRLWCVFGCGGDRDRGKRPLMAKIAEAGADVVIATSDNPRHESPQAILADIRAGFVNPGAVTVEGDRRAAINRAIALAEPADTVLIAGKGHESYQQIGDRKLPFSDIDEARAALAARNAGEGERQ